MSSQKWITETLLVSSNDQRFPDSEQVSWNPNQLCPPKIFQKSIFYSVQEHFMPIGINIPDDPEWGLVQLYELNHCPFLLRKNRILNMLLRRCRIEELDRKQQNMQRASSQLALDKQEKRSPSWSSNGYFFESNGNCHKVERGFLGSSPARF